MQTTIKQKEQTLTVISTKDLFLKIVNQLSSVYGDLEARSLAKLVLKYQLGSTQADIVSNKDVSVSQKELEDIQSVVNRLLESEPIQYIYGETDFYGRTFVVNPFVLIPRPETEELVHLIINENLCSGLKIIDIGTGSGCIPVTLAKELNNPYVYAIDIDNNALNVASKNAMIHRAPVNYFQLNILDQGLPLRGLDIIVSNPPYVRELEKAQMHQNVLSYEPSLALFVPDEDPLMFYRRISFLGSRFLKPGGKLYFEINEAFGSEVATLMEADGYYEISIVKDMQNKDRIVKGTLR